MESTIWVPLVSSALTAVVAAISIVVQRQAHREQTDREKRHHVEVNVREDRLRKEVVAREKRERRYALEQEHLRRLWDRRQAGYVAAARWALDIYVSQQEARDQGEIRRVPTLDLGLLAELRIYADHEVYANSELLRGRYEKVWVNAKRFEAELPPDFVSKELMSLAPEAHDLTMLIRQNALQLPDWREPIPLQRDGVRDAFEDEVRLPDS
jgi:hypothetical protein